MYCVLKIQYMEVIDIYAKYSTKYRLIMNICCKFAEALLNNLTHD